MRKPALERAWSAGSTQLASALAAAAPPGSVGSEPPRPLLHRRVERVPVRLAGELRQLRPLIDRLEGIADLGLAVLALALIGGLADLGLGDLNLLALLD